MDKYLTLVNEDNTFEKAMLDDFKMVKVRDTDGKTYMEQETRKAFKKLKKVMNEKYSIALSLTSAGRTIEAQQKVYEEIKQLHGKDIADKRVAKPGHSEHHLGLAIDVGVHKVKLQQEQIAYNSQFLTKVVNRLKGSTEKEESEMYEKLHAELAELGFILRYPEDKMDITKIKIYEPWHIRYVGVENAKQMQELGMCLEEYVEYLKEQELLV